MGKQELRQRETNVATSEGVGKQLEQTITVIRMIPHFLKNKEKN